MTSYEEMRKNGFIDVYAYGDKEIIKRYCDKHRYIPHYVDDFNLLKYEKLEYRVVVFSTNDRSDNEYGLVGLRHIYIEFCNGYAFPLKEFLEYQWEHYNDKMNYSRLKKAQQGIYIKGTPPYGYRKNKRKDLVCDDFEAFIVRYVFYRNEQGFGAQKICTELNKRGYTNRGCTKFKLETVRKILANKDFYMGYITQEGLERMKGVHTPLLKENGKVDMDYIDNHFRTEEEMKIIKRQMKNKKSPNRVVPYIEVKSYADIRRL